MATSYQGALSPDLIGQASAADIRDAAGTMREAESYTPEAGAFTSNRLNELLSSNSAYIQQARQRATAGAFARGLGNSSISVGAAEGAAIDRALPIAQDDARTTGDAGRFNVEQRNLFSRDANQFGRDTALTQYRGALDVRGQDLDNANRTADRAQRAAESAADIRLREGALALDTRRLDTSTELDRQRLGLDTQRFGLDTQRLGLDTQRVQADIANQQSTQQINRGRLDLDIAAQRERTAAETARLEENKARIVADLTQSQNLSSEVDSADGTSPKDRAILNAVAYFDTAIGNYVATTGINQPSAWPAPAGAPVPAPAPAPAPAPIQRVPLPPPPPAPVYAPVYQPLPPGIVPFESTGA